jgi:hypothetical protein
MGPHICAGRRVFPTLISEVVRQYTAADSLGIAHRSRHLSHTSTLRSIEISMLKPRFDPFRFSRPSGPTQQQRRQMIADAAYRRAEQRGFSRGNEVQDWLAAEREVDFALSLQFLKFY